MRTVLMLLAACVLHAQTTGKPGVTDPIKDPHQVPGKPHPGAIPRSTPAPIAESDENAKKEQTRARKDAKKQTKKAEKPKVNQSEQ